MRNIECVGNGEDGGYVPKVSGKHFAVYKLENKSCGKQLWTVRSAS